MNSTETYSMAADGTKVTEGDSPDFHSSVTRLAPSYSTSFRTAAKANSSSMCATSFICIHAREACHTSDTFPFEAQLALPRVPLQPRLVCQPKPLVLPAAH